MDEDNGDTLGYGNNTPYFSYNLLRGPDADIDDNIDNDRDGCIDCTYPKDANGNPIIGPFTDDAVVPEPTGMNTFIYYDNNFNAKTGNPTTTGSGVQYYRFLKSVWKDGTLVRHDGGNGTSSMGLPCVFVYPGSSDPYGYGVGGNFVVPNPQPAWTELNSTTGNQPGDRRFISSSGKITLSPSEKVDFDFAYVFTQDSVALAGGILYNKVVSDNKKIKKWFLNNNAPSCLDLSGVGLKEGENKINMLVYPNPATNNLTIDAGSNNTITGYNVYDVLGKEIFAQQNTNAGKTNINLNTLNSGVYLLHVQSQQGSYFTRFVKH